MTQIYKNTHEMSLDTRNICRKCVEASQIVRVHGRK